MSIFQIAAILFALFMLYVVHVHQRKLRLSTLEVFFWVFTWGTFILLSLFPETLQGIVNQLQFKRVFDLLIVIALMILTTLVITTHFLVRENAKKLEDLVRQLAINEQESSSDTEEN